MRRQMFQSDGLAFVAGFGSGSIKMGNKREHQKQQDGEMHKRQEQKEKEEKDRDPCDIIDEASDESFPASDPPSWTAAAL